MTFKTNVPLAQYTTFKIGGPARLYVEATGAIELAEAFERAEQEHLPVFVFSGGSNILFSDNGFNGLVIRLIDGGFRLGEDGHMVCGAGRTLYDVVEAACEAGFGGIESLAGIPGSIGGAVRGNAGAFGTEIGDVVTRVKTFHRETGMVREFRQAECEFGYRTSYFKTHPEYIVLSADFQLTPSANPQVLMNAAREVLDQREKNHPQDVFCAGSFFMNPTVTREELFDEFRKDSGKESRNGKLPAGWLIDHVGLRGKTIGHAKISTIHPNYLINTGEATAEDVIVLASVVKQKVRDELGVQLQEEVQFVGFGQGTANRE